MQSIHNYLSNNIVIKVVGKPRYVAIIAQRTEKLIISISIILTFAAVRLQCATPSLKCPLLTQI